MRMQATAGSSPLSVLPAIAAAMDQAIARGRVSADFAVFTRP